MKEFLNKAIDWLAPPPPPDLLKFVIAQSGGRLPSLDKAEIRIDYYGPKYGARVMASRDGRTEVLTYCSF